MKNNILIIVASMSLFACAHHEEDIHNQVPMNRIVATIPFDTKATLTYEPSGSSKVLWEEKDALGVFIDKGTSMYTYLLSEGGGTSIGIFTGPGKGAQYLGVYPSTSAGELLGDGLLTLKIPASQEYRYGSFGIKDNPMVAIGGADNLSFRNVFSLLHIPLLGRQVITSLVFRANDPSTMVAGVAKVCITQDGIPQVEMLPEGSCSMVLNVPGIPLNNNIPTDFFIALPPQDYPGGFTLTINTSTGSMTKVLSSNFSMTRSRIHSSEPIQVVLDSGSEVSTYLEGHGTEASPFLVGSLADLLLVQEAINATEGTIMTWEGGEVSAATAYFKMTTDIDLAPVCGETVGNSWIPIGNYSFDNTFVFNGVFDGDGHTISNLFISTEENSHQGLFGYSLGTIKNLSVRGFVHGEHHVALIAGFAKNVEGCKSFGRVIPVYGYAGGIVGASDGALISSCVNEAEVMGYSLFFGGIVGSAQSSTVVDCKNKGRIYNLASNSNFSYTGGIAGRLISLSVVQNCENSGIIEGLDFVGGIVGAQLSRSIVMNCLNRGLIRGSGEFIGGVVGGNGVGENNWYTDGDEIHNCVNLGDVSNQSDGNNSTLTGAICGFNHGMIKNCYWLYDRGQTMGRKEGIGYSDGSQKNYYSLSLLEMNDNPCSFPLYIAPSGEQYEHILKALNAWVYFNNHDKVNLCGWALSETGDYLVLNGESPSLPEADPIDSYFRLEATDMDVPGEGGNVPFTIMANLQYQIQQQPEWLALFSSTYDDESKEYLLTFRATPNYETIPRSGSLIICDSGGHCYEVSFNQAKRPSWYISEHFDRDGQTTVLQTASEGAGIDIVLMGDAFSDRQIEDGTYAKTMNRMMDAFFSEIPYSSYRNMFNVYCVDVVSFTEGYEHSGQALSGWFGDGSRVGGDDEACVNYALKAISSNRLDNALIIVAMNKSASGGTCYMYNPEYGDYGVGMSVSYFPVDESTLNEVVLHEAGGHGFAKLADEYYYNDNPRISESAVADYKDKEPFGWWKNVDFIEERTKVKWAKFITDERFSSEKIDVYEGACTYWTGAYRPTYDSIMRYGSGGFNAPSRYAIWYRINKLAYGADWTGTYEDFVTWDLAHRTPTTKSARPINYVEKDFPPLPPPVVVNKDWREVVNRGR